MTTEHPLTTEELMEFLDGELPDAEAAEVQAHVIACDDCRRLSAELRAISRDLGRWEVEDAPATLTAPPMPDRAGGWASIFGWIRWRPVVALSLGGAAVLASLVLLAGPYTINTKPVQVTAIRDPELSTAPAVSPPSSAGHEAGAGLPPVARVEADTALRYPSRLAASPTDTAEQSPSAVPEGPAIARTARLRLTTVDFDKTRAGVERTAAETGGWFRQLDVSGRQGQARSLTATVIVPAARLDDLLSAIRPLGTTLEESKQAEDVGEQIVDVQARLSNARNTERRLVDLLRQRTGKLSEVLEAEQEIGRVREEIERLDGRRQNLQRRVEYARLTLEVREELRQSVDFGPRPVSSRFRDAFVDGVTEGLSSMLEFALLVVRLLPVLLVWSAVLGWPILMLVRDYRKRKAPPPTDD